MNGRRIEPVSDPVYFQPGDYGYWHGTWYARTPNGHMANLGAHDLTEHPDGAITVSPSIRVSDAHGELWHGYLEKGVWRSC